ncbi:MAG: NlpC/P60 family protein [Balneola sp.]
MSVKQLLLLWVLFASCGMVKRGTIPWEERAKKAETKKESTNTQPVNVKPEVAISTSSEASKILSKDEKKVRSKLDEAFKDWKGVPYLLGGNGYDGVDCSAFLQIVFLDYFDIKLPRVTVDQMKVGKSVKKNNIRIGDLVFFKTGRKTMHAGVMINDQQFMHASTSSGVMISALQERYWNDTYLTTRRIL